MVAWQYIHHSTDHLLHQQRGMARVSYVLCSVSSTVSIEGDKFSLFICETNISTGCQGFVGCWFFFSNVLQFALACTERKITFTFATNKSNLKEQHARATNRQLRKFPEGTFCKQLRSIIKKNQNQSPESRHQGHDMTAPPEPLLPSDPQRGHGWEWCARGWPDPLYPTSSWHPGTAGWTVAVDRKHNSQTHSRYKAQQSGPQ